MTIRAFISANRAALDACIRGACPNLGKLNDEDRHEWILNDEGLYNWARSCGVQI
jgi:hypothetical protein